MGEFCHGTIQLLSVPERDEVAVSPTRGIILELLIGYGVGQHES